MPDAASLVNALAPGEPPVPFQYLQFVFPGIFYHQKPAAAIWFTGVATNRTIASLAYRSGNLPLSTYGHGAANFLVGNAVSNAKGTETHFGGMGTVPTPSSPGSTKEHTGRMASSVLLCVPAGCAATQSNCEGRRNIGLQPETAFPHANGETDSNTTSWHNCAASAGLRRKQPLLKAAHKCIPWCKQWAEAVAVVAGFRAPTCNTLAS